MEKNMDSNLNFNERRCQFHPTSQRVVVESERDFRWFLHIAIGSAFELETQLTISQQLGLIPKKRIEPILLLLSDEQKMINSFISTIKIGKPNPNT
jgi:23S rRNA-intervening sequence protein